MTKVRQGLAVFVRGAAVFALLALFTQAASAATPAETFVQQSVNRGVALLTDKALPSDQRRAQVEDLLGTIMNTRRLALFCLGKVAATAPPADVDAFATAFRAYSERVYRDRLNDYRGEAVKVTGSTVRKPGDVIVHTQISGGQLKEPVLVSWRVLGGEGSWRVVDVEFKGVWLAIAQQQDFVSTLDNAHGDIDVLISKLNELAKHPLPKQ